jgi:hypothetical protein
VPLTEEEQKQLDELQRKAEEPPSNRQEAVQIVVDLSDPGAVKRALAHGYLTASDVNDDQDDDEEGDDDDEGDDQDDDEDSKGKSGGKGRRKPKPETPPKRGGYFGEK